MFKLQRQLQKRVFGTGYWERIEKRAMDNYGNTNKNEFNPRHVQILLRTYQTGGAVAVLSHTGDPNQGLREWYENEKENGTKGRRDKDDMVADSPGLLDGDTSDGGLRVAAKGGNLKETTLGKMRRFHPWSQVRPPLGNIPNLKEIALLTRQPTSIAPTKSKASLTGLSGERQSYRLLKRSWETPKRTSQPRRNRRQQFQKMLQEILNEYEQNGPSRYVIEKTNTWTIIRTMCQLGMMCHRPRRGRKLLFRVK